MPRPRPALLGLFVLAAVPFALTVGPAYTQQPNDGGAGPKQFDTADLVTLKGFFYPGSGKGTVLLLHALGEDSNKAEWINLAKALNKNGYAVLRFDFRGHGESTAVDPGNPTRGVPGFWDYPENRMLNGAAKRPKVIDAKMFAKHGSYLHILANDIEAARAWLDANGDGSPLILIGAKEGATIAAIWLNAAFNCYPIVPNPMKFGMKEPDLRNPVGKSVRAGIWLSMTSTLAGSKINLPSTLNSAGQEKTPLWFLYAAGDSKSKATAKYCVKILAKGKKDAAVAASDIPNAERLAGSALLTKSLGTTDAILSYLGALPARPAMKGPRGMVDGYIWQWPPGQAAPARIGDRLGFFNFQPFVRR